MSDNIIPQNGNGSVVRSFQQIDSALTSIVSKMQSLENSLSNVASRSESVGRSLGGATTGIGPQGYSIAGTERLPKVGNTYADVLLGGGGTNVPSNESFLSGKYTGPTGSKVGQELFGLTPSFYLGVAGGNRVPPAPSMMQSPASMNNYQNVMLGGNGGNSGGNSGTTTGDSGGGWNAALKNIVLGGMVSHALGSAVAGVNSTYNLGNIYSRLRLAANGTNTSPNLPEQIANNYSGGYLSSGDLQTALQTGIDAGLSPWLTDKAFSRGIVQTARDTASSASGAMGLIASYSTPQAQAIGIRYGIRVYDPMTGKPTLPDSFLQQVINATGGQQKTLAGVQAAYRPGGSMYYSLAELGLNPAQIASLEPLQQAAFKAHTNVDFQNKAFNAALQKQGTLTRPELSLMNRAGAAGAVDALQYNSQAAGIQAANDAARGLSDSLYWVNRYLVSFANNLGMIKGSVGGTLNGSNGGSTLSQGIGTFINDVVLASLFRGGKGAAGAAAAAGTAAGEAAAGGAAAGGAAAGGAGAVATTATEVAGLSLMSRLGGGLKSFATSGAVRIGGAFLAPQAGYALTNDVTRHISNPAARRGVSVLGGALSGAATGALLGAEIPILGGPLLGAAAGGIIGGVMGSGVLGGIARGLGWGANISTGGGHSTAPSGSANSVVQFAEKYLGIPYSWGGGNTSGPTRGIAQGANTVGFDCSSFVQFVMAHFGVSLPRTTFDQVNRGSVVPDIAHAIPGDLCFYGLPSAPDHVGIYIGNGRIIQAPHTGAVVDITGAGQPSVIKRVLGSNITAVGSSSGAGSPLGAPGGPTSANPINPVSQAVWDAARTSAANFAPPGFLAVSGGSTVTVGGTGSSTGSGPSAAVSNISINGNVTPASFATSLLSALHRPTTKSNVATIVAWEAAEGGNWHNPDRFNPLNTTLNAPGASSTNSAGVKAYTSWQQGFNATVATLAQGNMSSILNALASGSTNPNAIAHTIASSPWGTGSFSVPGYATGAWKIRSDQIAKIHEGEMILEKPVAQAVRQMVSTGSSGGGGGPCNIQLNVKATAGYAEAVRLAQMVKNLLEHDKHIDWVGSR